jgi:hypothetical protein
VLKNGYGDHFLQDSFASGHLVNKTLVMQWFAQYVRSMNWLDEPLLGHPSREALSMAQEGGIAGQHLYGKSPSATATSTADRERGVAPTDPQTAFERTDADRRRQGVGGSGKGENWYVAFRRFLNNAFLQAAGNDVHDWFNKRGLLVSNDRGDEFYVGGDGTLLNENVAGSLGVWLTSEAARLSRQAIQDLLHHGRTAITVDEIFGYVPQYIWAPRPEGETMAAPGPGAPTWQKKSLAEWHDEDLHSICMAVIFPQVASSFINLVGARVVQQHLVHGGAI